MRGRFEQLLTAAVSILSHRDLGEVLQRITDVARDVVRARYAALGVLGEDSESLSEFLVSGMTPAQREHIGAPPSGRGLLGLVIRERRPIRCADIMSHRQRYGFPAGHPEMHSFLGVPILGRGRVFGNLYLTEKIGADAFDAEDEAIAVLLASLASVAIENARLIQESDDLVRQIRAMQRQRDLFFAMMNHELRNALTGVFGWAERVLRVKSEAELRQAAGEVYESSERAISLLNNLLDLTRLDAGKLQPVVRDIDAVRQVERAVASVRPEAETRGVAIEIHSEGEPRLRTDPVRFEQIIVNLLSNAIRHGAGQRPVMVTIEADATELRVHVRDYGPGIAPEIQERIFEPFERSEGEGTRGSGLGLAVARGLAELLGGGLRVRSAVGEGATFTLTLPATNPSQ